MKAVALLFLILVAAYLPHRPAFSQGDFWLQTNGPLARTVLSMATTGSGTIIAGTDHGVFSLLDSSQSWIERNNGLPDGSISAVAVDSTGTLYAGGNGIYCSTDGGGSWELIGLEGTTVHAVALNSSGHIFVANTYVDPPFDYYHNVYRSTNRGLSWSAITPGPNDPLFSIALNSLGHIFVGGDTEGIYRSTDDGSNWVRLITGLSSVGVSAIVVNPFDVVFAGTAGDGIYRSLNNGDSWEQVNDGLTNLIMTTLTSSGSDPILAGTYGDGVFQSADDGTTWMPIGSGLRHRVVYALAVRGNGILAGTEGGGAYSLLSDSTWQSTNEGLVDHLSDVRSLHITDEGRILAGLRRGLQQSTDYGESWVEIGLEFADATVNSTLGRSIIGPSGRFLFAGTDRGIYRSEDFGQTWDVVLPMVDEYVNTIDLSPNGYIFAGTSHGAYRSADNGESWVLITNGMSSPRILSFTFDSMGFTYAGTYPGVYHSGDDGDHWTLSIVTGTSQPVNALATDSAGNIYAGTGGYGVYKSVNRGLTWEQIGIPYGNVTSIVVQNSYELFAGTRYGGVYRSTDQGGTWTQVNSGLATLSVSELALHPDGFIFAGTGGSGVFKSSSSVLAVEGFSDNQPRVVALLQNYPNPFNPTTTFSFSVPQSSFINLAVYDLLGREVATIVNEKLGSGTHTRQWDAAGLASGVYVYRLNVGEFVQSRKLVLIR